MMSKKTANTAVLVHGGTLTSTMWDAVRARMVTPSVAVDLPGRRHKPADLAEIHLDDWIESVCNDISCAGLTDVTLVGHSSGGYVLPGVAARLSTQGNVAIHSLVFVAATVPAEGMRPLDYLREDIRTHTRLDALVERAKGRTIGGLREGEGPINTPLEIVENGPRMGVEAPVPLFESVSWANYPFDIPRYYVRCLRDKVIPPDLADVMIANMSGAIVIDMDAGHRAFDRSPAELAEVLDGCCSRESA